MGRYIVHLERNGASRRKLSAILSDLQAQALIVFMHETSGPKEVVDQFCLSDDFVFRRKFTDSPRAVERYEGSVEAFEAWVERS